MLMLGMGFKRCVKQTHSTLWSKHGGSASGLAGKNKKHNSNPCSWAQLMSTNRAEPTKSTRSASLCFLMVIRAAGSSALSLPGTLSEHFQLSAHPSSFLGQVERPVWAMGTQGFSGVKRTPNMSAVGKLWQEGADVSTGCDSTKKTQHLRHVESVLHRDKDTITSAFMLVFIIIIITSEGVEQQKSIWKLCE